MTKKKKDVKCLKMFNKQNVKNESITKKKKK